ncbi:uroporphyrinogen-III C-methyltransferase [Parablautia sp. Marseille-Q6255]|uniref:uroporphyrinogen-III C-methyltransferase n=1 Tax=Parablautia sp. Marseille-Q6255 TaxID=3039593 RepID=UPI0024BC121F|nr:uroporphyrinogen-III C-methyltransferase [Parablautia sp. Marseille-Q6255]
MDNKKTGKVWLVGAGPSDPGLFTIKGKQVLEEAQVVVYDALVGDGILQMIPEKAQKINVGKRSSNHTMPQEKISGLLVEKAREGKRVVRLKGGDPFLFGRGGEEIELLVKEGIPYEVVPGITSAIAVPAYQGIPVTHRDFCSSVHIITGHKRAGASYDIDFEALVRTGGTLVFLMGVSSLPDICNGLLDAGMRPDMPAALLMRGTTAKQERILATVGTLAQEVRKHGARTPAIIVVGAVCTLADTFSWYEKQPLGGAKVMVTRPKERIGKTAAKLRALGAQVVELPAIDTVKRQDNTRLQEALGRLHSYQWIVFTSPAGVRFFFEELRDSGRDVRCLAGARFAVIGSGTAKELFSYGIQADLMPEVYDAEHLGAALAAQCTGGERILIPRAAQGSLQLIQRLAEKETLEIDDIATYDTQYVSDEWIDAKEELETGQTDYVLFTSASTVHGFAAVTQGLDYTKVKAVCIGRQTEEAAASLGMRTWRAKQASTDSLVERLVEVYTENRQK